MEAIDLSWLPMLDGVGTIGLCVLVVIAIARGWLVPAKTHRQVVQLVEEARDHERTRAIAADKAREHQQQVAQDLLDRIIATLGSGRGGERDG